MKTVNSARSTSSYLRSFDSSTATDDGSDAMMEESDTAKRASRSPRPTAADSAATECKLIPARLLDLGSSTNCVAFAAWGEREWAIRACGFKVQLYCVDFSGSQYQSYQWFVGDDLNRDLPVCCVFAPPLIPLQPPSSLHECRALGSIGTFAIAWARVGTNEVYVKVYDPEEAPAGASSLCQDHRWVERNHFPVSVGKVTTLAFTPGGSHLLAGGAGGLQLWNLILGPGEEVWSSLGEENCPGGIDQVQFSSDGRLFASVAPKSKMVRVWWRSESASHGGFAFRLLPHGDAVKSICWRPRSASSLHGSAQSLLTQCESGVVRIWQESDLLEDFDIYVVSELKSCSPTALTSWIEYYADYEGMLWPPPASFRRALKRGDLDEENIKRNKSYSSKRTWGTLDRGHGHAWFGEAAFDNLESRLGSIPSSNARDWIISLDRNQLNIWEVEGLGEHARAAIRCMLWTQQETSLNEPVTRSLAFCRFLLPVCHEGRSIPKCDDLYADNSPLNLRICAQTASGGLAQVSVEFESEDQRLADIQPVLFPGHKSCDYQYLCSGENGDLVTIDGLDRLVWWSTEFKPKRIIDLQDKVSCACFCSSLEDEQLAILQGDALIVYGQSSERILSREASPNETLLGKHIGLFSFPGRFILVRENGIISIAQSRRYVLKQIQQKVLSASISASGGKLWLGLSDGRLLQLDASIAEEDAEPEESIPKTLEQDRINDDSASVWVPRKVVCAGVWIVRLLQQSTSSRSMVLVTSIASNDIEGALSEEEASPQRISGLNEDADGVVDIAFHEFSSSGICGIAILTKKGQVKIASKKQDRWAVVASSTTTPCLHHPETIIWHRAGMLIAFGGSGEVLEYSGWTASTRLPWTFAGGLNGPNWMLVEFKPVTHAKLRPAISSSTCTLSSSNKDGVSFDEVTGHIAWICASLQFALPSHHPQSILEDIRQGRLIRVGRVLQHLNKALEADRNPNSSVFVSPCEFKPGDEKPKWGGVSTSTSSSSTTPATAAALFGSGPNTAAALFGSGPSTAAALFAAPTVSSDAQKSVAVDEDESDWLEQLESRLPSARIASLSPADHLRLLSCVGLYRRLANETVSGLDPAASRYALAVETLRMSTRGALSSTALKTAEVAWAMHSDAQTALLKNFAESPDTTWHECRALGVAFWAQTPTDLKALAERLAKTHFIKFDRDPFRCLLFYAALEKPRVASALFKAAKNEKVAMLLAQDFTQERWRSAAAKNAFALVERKRYDEAAAFFLFAAKPAEALRVLSRNLEDFQLALFIGKVIALNGNPDYVNALDELLRVIYLEVARAVKDPWLCSMIYTHLGEHENSIKCFTNSFFTEDPSEAHSVRVKRRERYSWLREVAARDKPRLTTFDPVVVAFLQYLKQRPYTLKYAPLLAELEKESANRAALFYLAEGLPRLADNLLFGDSADVSDLRRRARISALLPEVVTEEHITDSTIAADIRLAVLSSLRELRLMKLFLGLVEENATEYREAINKTISRITFGFRNLAFGGISSARVSARRLACYSLTLNLQVERISQLERVVASFAAYAGIILSATMLKQYAWLESIYSSGPFEPGKQLHPSVAHAGENIAKNFQDYEENAFESGLKLDWVPMLARDLLKVLIFEDLVEKGASSLAFSTRGTNGANLIEAIGALISRIRDDAHYSLTNLPDPSSSTFAAIVDPLRPYLATSRSFDDPNEQALFVRFSGPERVLKLIGEVAHAVRFRNKRPFLPSHISPCTPSAIAFSTPPEARKGPLTAITLYQSPGEFLTGVCLGLGFPEYMVVASYERGTRDVSIKSSLRYRNRTPDGRGLTDTERESYEDVLNRFADQERDDTEEGWELFLSTSATGMRSKLHGASQGSLLRIASPPAALRRARSSMASIKRAGSFLSLTRQRMTSTMRNYVRRNSGRTPTVPAPQYGRTRDHPVTRISPHPFLPVFASGSHEGHCLLWHVGEPGVVCTFLRPASFTNRAAVTRLRVSPDGYKLLSGDAAGRCVLWQIEQGDSTPFLNINCAAPSRAISDLAFLNMSSCFATCSAEGIVSLWDTLLPSRSSCVASWYAPVTASVGLPTSAPTIPALQSLCFCPQTRCIFTGTDRGTVFAIDVRKCKTAVEGKGVHSKSITSLALSPDGYHLGTGSMDGGIKLISADDLSVVSSVPNLHPYSFTHHQAVTEVAFAPNGSLFSCGADGTVKITYSSEAVM